MSAGIYPWLFLIPPVVIALAGIITVLFRRTELGRARRRFVLHKFNLSDPEAEQPDELTEDDDVPAEDDDVPAEDESAS